MKRLLFTIAMAICMATTLASPAYAAPNPTNPNTVAYYPDGMHAIPTEPLMWFVGVDIVNKLNDKGSFDQWFYADGFGYHSLWTVMKNDSCLNGVVFQNPYPEWGDYLT